MGLVAHCHYEAQINGIHGNFIVHVHMRDIGFCIGQFYSHLGQHAFAVADRDHYAGFKKACGFVSPVHCNKSLAVLVLQALCHDTTGYMHDQALAAP